MRGDLEDKTATVEVLNLKGVEDRREVLGVELDINDSTDDGFYRADLGLCLRGISARCCSFSIANSGEKVNARTSRG